MRLQRKLSIVGASIYTLVQLAPASSLNAFLLTDLSGLVSFLLLGKLGLYISILSGPLGNRYRSVVYRSAYSYYSLFYCFLHDESFN